VPWVLVASWLAFAVAEGQIARGIYGGVGFAVCAFVAVFGLRPILIGIAKLDRERNTLREQFDRARVESHSDSLTGLGNLRALMDELDLQVAAGTTQGKRFALILANVDNLKAVNDEYGHAIGDEVLRATARIISGNMRRWDQAFRMGGDQFAVVLQDCGPDDGVIIARRMLNSALEGGVGGASLIPAVLKPKGFSITLGVSAFPDPSKDRKQLLLQADAALRYGKEHGRTDVQLYDVRRHPVPVDAATIEELGASVLRVAATHAMTPVYQPIYSLTTGKVLGYEGLVRPKADTGFTNPGAMFNAAQASGRTVELDMAALEVVVGGAGELPALQYLSVNLAPRTLEAEAFNPYEVLSLVRRYGIDPSRILLELTERDEVTDMAHLKEVLAIFRKHGMRTALDDCGEGSGKQMRWLVELSFNVMKIDMWFVRSKGSSGVLRGFGEMARSYNMTVVAEGIETPEHLELVIGQGFGAGQGYLLRRPGPALDAPDLDLDALLGKGSIDPGAMISR
jgi:diguanylate cyclase (GGDEF)-like protein